MAIRTTDAEVRAIIDTDSETSMAQFITNGSVVTDQIVTKASDLGITVPTAVLTLIETYLAAHFYALFDPQAQVTKSGRSEMEYQGKTGKGFDATWWGQQAIALDPTGSLGTVSVSLTWVGKNPA